MRTSILLIATLLLNSFAQPLAAQNDAKKPTEPQETLIEFSPMAISTPSLKYPLLPPPATLTPGNAALLYHRAVAMTRNLQKQINDMKENLPELLDSDKKDFPIKDAKKRVEAFRHSLGEIRLAARRQHCEWELPTVETGTDLYGLLLSEVQPLREIARMLAIRIRIEIHEGRFDDAVDSLQTGYAMGRHMANAPFLINALVGVAICRMMDERVIELAREKDAPNLYWSLTALPRPIIDMRRSLEFEAASAFQVFPELPNAVTVGGEQSAREFEAFIKRFEQLADASANTDGPEYEMKERLTKMLKDEAAMKKARSYLVSSGFKANAVQKMPATQVLLLREKTMYEQDRDNLFKWCFLPYHQARPGFEQWAKDFRAAREDGSTMPLVSLLLPGIDRASQVEARTGRTNAALRIVESIRDYAAANDGQVPASLDDLTLPVSKNPVDDKPFEYARKGNEATLRSHDGVATAIRFRLRVRKAD